MNFFRQCIMRNAHGTTITWIEEPRARVGNRIRIDDETWWVLTVGEARVPESMARLLERPERPAMTS